MSIKHSVLSNHVRSEKRDTRHAKRMVTHTPCDNSLINKDEALQGYASAKRYEELDIFQTPSWKYGWHLYWQTSNRKTKVRRTPLYALREKRIVNS